MTKTILIVEDDAIAALAMEHMLTKAGYTVLTADTGEDALGFIRSEKDLVDLVLMDLDLGKGMTGAVTARAILLDQDIPVIFVSAHTEEAAAHSVEDIPSYGFVTKHSGDHVLLASIRMACRLHDAHRALTASQQTEASLRQTQERFRVVFNNINDAVFIHGFDEDWLPGQFVEVNDVACVRYGYSREEFLRMSPLDIETHESTLIRPQRMERLKTEGSGVWECTHRTKSGQVIPVEISNVVFLMDGEPMILASVRDISERKRAEDALRQNERQLIQAQKLEGIGTLAGGIAHDFNNLLAMILGSAELLRTHTADQPQLKRYVDRIIEASERGATISRQLLIFSKPDGSTHAPLRLSTVVTEFTDMLAHFMSKSISVESVIGVENGTILGDLGQIHQALLNIALNAGDAMPDGGTLRVCACVPRLEAVRKKFPLADSPAYIAISVTDSGKGMNEDIRQRIFDPFFTTKDRGKGTGLGLAIVHGIMKNHNGFIDVESAPGMGTTFTLYFPGLAANTAAAAEPTPAAPPQHAETILIVDDEIVIREALQECLEDFGYRVFAAANGADALALFKEHQASIDLVITDFGMPGISGEELFRQLAKIDPSVKVMLSSGYLDNETQERMLVKRNEYFSMYEKERNEQKELALLEYNRIVTEARLVLDEKYVHFEAEYQRKKADKQAGFEDKYNPLTEEIGGLRSSLKQIASIEQTQKMIEQMVGDVDSLEAKSQNLTTVLATIEQIKLELLKDLPIEGLEIIDGEIFQNSVVFDRLNTAEQIKIALTIAQLRIGELKLLCVDGVERLDEEALNELRKQSEAAGLQLFLAKVSNSNLNIIQE